jgi:DNA gyrase subunit B
LEARELGATHDWSSEIDVEHLDRIRAAADRYSPGGALHLVLEVLAYAVDEALEGSTTRVVVTAHRDGSFSVADNGRGTEMRYDDSGRARRKPVMGTRDLRFFDLDTAPNLPDGHARSGMSVVTALSEWLTHTTCRDGRSWVQRYERGLPVGALTETQDAGATGTTVRFRPDALGARPVSMTTVEEMCAPVSSVVLLEYVDEASAGHVEDTGISANGLDVGGSV